MGDGSTFNRLARIFREREAMHSQLGFHPFIAYSYRRDRSWILAYMRTGIEKPTT